jgi:hypothetical protein
LGLGLVTQGIFSVFIAVDCNSGWCIHYKAPVKKSPGTKAGAFKW